MLSDRSEQAEHSESRSCRIDLIVLRIYECLLSVMMEFQAATNLSRDPFVYVNRDTN
jgi:hypothetical protein